MCAMKRIRFWLFFFCLATVINIGSTPAARGESIRSFNVDIRLQKDTTLDITESIVMDFGETYRHGIERRIPIKYDRNGGQYSIYLKVISVRDVEGNPWNFKTSRIGRDLNIRIGDADKTIRGDQNFVLHYTVRRAINFFDGAPEAYWNVTGDQWPYPIGQASARFFPPPGVKISDIKIASFIGPPGSTQPGNSEAKSDHILFSASDVQPGSGLTMLAGLPKGSVVAPSSLQNLLWFLADWWPAFLVPILAAIAIGVLWLQSGRDVEGGQAIAVEWNPPINLTPAEVGTLVDEHCDMADIVSTLVDLAARGYLVIQETATEKFLFLSSKDYTFIRRHDGPTEAQLLPYERTFLKGVFRLSDRATLSSLKNNFYTNLPEIRSGIYQSLLDKHLFRSHPESTRTSFVGGGIALGVLGFALVFMLGSLAWAIGFVVAGVLVAFFARAMPSKTATGSKMLRQCLGFQRYVALAEKERIKVLADKDPTIFGRMLPYAMVLGVADQWADAFKDLLTEPPDWYIGPGYGHGFMPGVFVNDLGSGMNTMGNTFSSQPKSEAGSGGSGFSSGGGFSGGGFGGGGGGSW